VAVDGEQRQQQKSAPYPGAEVMQDGDEEDGEEGSTPKDDSAGGAPAGGDFNAQQGRPLGVRLCQGEELGTGPESAVDEEVEVIPTHIRPDDVAAVGEVILEVVEEGDAIENGGPGLFFFYPEGEGFFTGADIAQGSGFEVFDIFEAEVRLRESVFVARIAPVERLEEEKGGHQRTGPPFGLLQLLLPGREDTGEERGREAGNGQRGEKTRESGQKRQGKGDADVVLQTGQEE